MNPFIQQQTDYSNCWRLSSPNCWLISALINGLIDTALFRVSLTLVTQQTLLPIRAETNCLQRWLWDARGSMTAGVALTGAELTQSAGVKRRALTEPVLSITENEGKQHQECRDKDNEREGEKEKQKRITKKCTIWKYVHINLHLQQPATTSDRWALLKQPERLNRYWWKLRVLLYLSSSQ